MTRDRHDSDADADDGGGWIGALVTVAHHANALAAEAPPGPWVWKQKLGALTLCNGSDGDDTILQATAPAVDAVDLEADPGVENFIDGARTQQFGQRRRRFVLEQVIHGAGSRSGRWVLRCGERS